MKVTLALLGLLFVTGASRADSSRDALDDAATAALWRLRGAGDEHLGLLYDSGGLKWTPTRTMGRRDESRGEFAVPQGSLRALFHNHPSSRDSAVKFSPDDVVMAKRYGVPSYLLVGDTVRRYTPDPRDNGHKSGEEVLGQIPLDEIRKLYLVRGLLK